MQIKGGAATSPAPWNPLIWQFLNSRSTFSGALMKTAATVWLLWQIAGAGFYMMAVIK